MISQEILVEARDIVIDIDENDALFIALTNHINGVLWTGDKKLVSGLKKKNYLKTISTDKLYKLFFEKQITGFSGLT